MEPEQTDSSCSVCLDPLNDPVGIPCGHRYCRSCISGFWDREDEKKVYSCPQCRQTFTPRPVLTDHSATEEEPVAGPSKAPRDEDFGDVVCDFCTGMKRKASKSCLQCLASFCQEHLQPHLADTPLKKHRLAEPTAKLRDLLCPIHDEVMKMFCLTDQQCICHLCPLEEHKGHSTVSAAAERVSRQEQLDATHTAIQQRLADGEDDVKLLDREMETIVVKADEAETKLEEEFAEMISLLEQKRSELQRQIREQRQEEVRRVQTEQAKLQENMAELRKKDAQLLQLPHIDEDVQFLSAYPSLEDLSQQPDRIRSKLRPLSYFDNLAEVVSDIKSHFESFLTDQTFNMSKVVQNVDVLLAPDEPKTRSQLRKYSTKISLDPDTAHKNLRLSVQNREVYRMEEEDKSVKSNAERFTNTHQVLSQESLKGRFYQEVTFTSKVTIAVAYDDIHRSGRWSTFGENWFSWALTYDSHSNKYTFQHNRKCTELTAPKSDRIGLYLDQTEGVLSFFSISTRGVIPLHRAQIKFTDPLHVGLGFSECKLPSVRLWY